MTFTMINNMTAECTVGLVTVIPSGSASGQWFMDVPIFVLFRRNSYDVYLRDCACVDFYFNYFGPNPSLETNCSRQVMFVFGRNCYWQQWREKWPASCLARARTATHPKVNKQLKYHEAFEIVSWLNPFIMYGEKRTAAKRQLGSNGAWKLFTS